MKNEDKLTKKDHDNVDVAKAIIDGGHSVMIGCFAIAAAISDGLMSITFSLAVFLYISIRLVWAVFNKEPVERAQTTNEPTEASNRK